MAICASTWWLSEVWQSRMEAGALGQDAPSEPRPSGRGALRGARCCPPRATPASALHATSVAGLTPPEVRATLAAIDSNALMETSSRRNVLQRVRDGGSRMNPAAVKIPPEQRPERMTQ